MGSISNSVCMCSVAYVVICPVTFTGEGGWEDIDEVLIGDLTNVL